MLSRRISSYNNIKPIQAITVDAFSNFNSENINRLTRIVSGSGSNDVVVNGLDVYGIDEPFSIKSSNLLDKCNWTCDGLTKYPTDQTQNNEFEFERKTNIDKYYSFAETTIDSNSIPHNGRYSGYFELQFQLLNGTPSYLVFNLNKHVLDLKHLDMFNYKENSTERTESGIHRLIFKYDFNFDNTFVFRIGIYQNNKDSSSINNGCNIILKNVRLYQIFDNSKLDYYLSQESIVEYDKYGTSNVHPIHKLGVSCGVAIKDNVTIDLLKSNFNDSKKIVELDTLSPSSWILSNPYTINDFSKRFCRPQVPVFGNGLNTDEKFYFNGYEGRLKYQIASGNEIYVTDDFKTGSNDYSVSIINAIEDSNVIKITYNKAQIKQNTKWLVLYSNNKPIVCVHKPYYSKSNSIEFYNDNSADLRNLSLKCLDNTLKVDGSKYSKDLVHWAYVVVYSEYFKNPVSNKNYIGLIRDEDLQKPEYREDYLILAKVRFVDPYTIDIITYSNSRQDLGVITAEDVNYFVTCKSGEIWNDDTPNTVTDALDILRLKEIDNYIKEKYKHDYDAEISDTFNLIKSDNDKNINVKTKLSVDNYSQLLRQTTSDSTKIKVTKIERDSNNNPYFNTISVNSIFTLNQESTHFVFTDSNNEKWAVSKDFKEFGKFENNGQNGYTIHRKYISFNEFGPIKFIDVNTTLPVIEFDWVYNNNAELRIPSSVNTKISLNNIESDKTDVKDDYALSYHPDESSSNTNNNNSKNHNQFISFRNNLLSTSRIKDELNFLPNNPDTLLNKRILYGIKDSDNKVRIYSSRHQLSDDMIDYHIINSVNNDSGLTVNSNNNGILDKSTKFIFDGDRPNNTFRTSTFLTSKTEGSSKVIIDTNYYYNNLINKRITISTDQDENDVYHIESGSYDMDDLLYQYWFKPDAQIIDNKLHLRIDTEKNFIVRFSDIFIFLYKWCGSTGTRLSQFLNSDPSLSDRKMIDIIVDIDCTISKLRDLDRRLDGEYETIDKYFKSKLLIINDCNETVKDDDYFNTYINTNFTFFYYPDSNGKYTPFRTAYNKHNNYVTTLGYDLNSTNGRVYISNNQFIWKDDRRGWNNNKNDISSFLNVYPVTSKSRLEQTVADYVINDNNAFDKARGCIRHTYSGCRTEFNFEYIKRYEPQDPKKNLPQYGIENSIDQSTDSDIEAETSNEKFIHTLDKLFATAEYYTISNKKVNTWKGENTNWIFTTDEGVISVLNQDEIVGDSLDELEEKIIESNISDSYTAEELKDLEDFDEYSKGLAHIRIHKLQNVNNKNNGCINLHLHDDENTESYRWIFSWEGDTGIWRSDNEKCSGRLSLISTSSRTNSSTFDVKQMVSWRNGIPEDESIIVLSSQNKDLRSTVEVIPLNSIVGKNSNGNLYKYLSNNPDDSGLEAISKTSFVGNVDLQGSEFKDHMLVNNICIADSIENGDMMMYIGKQRKDKMRFPPDTLDGKCSDTYHHSSIIRTSWNPQITKTKNKKTTIIKDPIKMLQDPSGGMDISTGYIKLNRNIKPTSLIGNLKFDEQVPSTSTINTIYSLHLGDSRNRFLCVGCANNFNTGIDWEYASYYSYGNTIPDKDYSNIWNVKKYGDTTIHAIPIKYGIPKSIYEYDGRIYIATVNGLIILDTVDTNPSDSTKTKWISFSDILKHTKWRVPYNYRYKHNENNGENILSWMTSTPNNSYPQTDELNVSDWIKIKDGVYGVCGINFVGIYDRDVMTSLTRKTVSKDDSLLHYEYYNGDSKIFEKPAIIDYDKYGNNIIVCGLVYSNSTGTSSTRKLIYNLDTKYKDISSSSLEQVITISNGVYAATSSSNSNNLLLYTASWTSSNKFTFVNKSSNIVGDPLNKKVQRMSFYNGKLYCFCDGFIAIYTYNGNLENPGLIRESNVPGTFNCKGISKIMYDFDSMYFLRYSSVSNNNVGKLHLTKLTDNSISNLYAIDNIDIWRLSVYRYVLTDSCTKNYEYNSYGFRYSKESKLFVSKFKARSIVFGWGKNKNPFYYDPFKTNSSDRISNNIQICANDKEHCFPAGTPMTHLLAGGYYIGYKLHVDDYPAIVQYPFPYYNLIYDRNIDNMIFAVNGNLNVYFPRTCCV